MLSIQGFKQSGIPVTVVAHCYEQTTFSEYDIADYDYLNAFQNMKICHDVLAYSLYFSFSWRSKNILSMVDFDGINPAWYSPIIFS